jgi:fumarylpyruvate hydrolase
VYVFAPAEIPSVPVAGRPAERYAVHRIYCVGRNYAEHAREMGADPAREPPFFFDKPPDAVVPGGGEIPYPPATRELHHEIELVVALGEGGAVYGYAVGNDLTRRDLQREAREQRKPWDPSKGFDRSAPIGPIHRAADVGTIARGRIWLDVNGVRRQDADLSALTWSVPEILQHLGALYALRAGDLVFTGTPAGVGPLVAGDRAVGGIDGLGTLEVRIVAP